MSASEAVVVRREPKAKLFNDAVHGVIELHPLSVRVIDTPECQRLRDLKQLGGAYTVYPSASHNRFEHSLGVAHLARTFVRRLAAQQPELCITPQDMLCVEIAGLIHDLGHGILSHMFDSKYMHAKRPDCIWEHEFASVDMFKHLLVSNSIVAKRKDPATGRYDRPSLWEEHGLTWDGGFRDDVRFIQELVLGKPGTGHKEFNTFVYRGSNRKRCLYEIVANKRNGIDVDKWDYFQRDARSLGVATEFNENAMRRLMIHAYAMPDTGAAAASPAASAARGTAQAGASSSSAATDPDPVYQIAYDVKVAKELYGMFRARWHLHVTAYQHRVSRAIEIMYCEALIAAGDHFTVGGSAEETEEETDAMGRTRSIRSYVRDSTGRTVLDSNGMPMVRHKQLKMHETVEDMTAYSKLSDYVLRYLAASDDPKLESARAILKRIARRQIYTFIMEATVPNMVRFTYANGTELRFDNAHHAGFFSNKLGPPELSAQRFLAEQTGGTVAPPAPGSASKGHFTTAEIEREKSSEADNVLGSPTSAEGRGHSRGHGHLAHALDQDGDAGTPVGMSQLQFGGETTVGKGVRRLPSHLGLGPHDDEEGGDSQGTEADGQASAGGPVETARTEREVLKNISLDVDIDEEDEATGAGGAGGAASSSGSGAAGGINGAGKGKPLAAKAVPKNGKNTKPPVQSNKLTDFMKPRPAAAGAASSSSAAAGAVGTAVASSTAAVSQSAIPARRNRDEANMPVGQQENGKRLRTADAGASHPAAGSGGSSSSGAASSTVEQRQATPGLTEKDKIWISRWLVEFASKMPQHLIDKAKREYQEDLARQMEDGLGSSVPSSDFEESAQDFAALAGGSQDDLVPLSQMGHGIDMDDSGFGYGTQGQGRQSFASAARPNVLGTQSEAGAGSSSSSSVGQLREEDFLVDLVNIDYGAKGDDPMKNVLFFTQNKATGQVRAVTVSRKMLGEMVVPTVFRQQYIRLYSKNKDKAYLAQAAFLYFCRHFTISLSGNTPWYVPSAKPKATSTAGGPRRGAEPSAPRPSMSQASRAAVPALGGAAAKPAEGLPPAGRARAAPAPAPAVANGPSGGAAVFGGIRAAGAQTAQEVAPPTPPMLPKPTQDFY